MPRVSFEHIHRMSDDTGLFEHARGALPRREHGYCLDDVARGLVVLGREPVSTAAEVALTVRYLAFVAHAQDPDGRCRNRLSFDRRWEDDPSTGDWWGRALWGMGTVVAGSGPAWVVDEALDRFTISCQQRSPWPRALAFAALGAAEVVDVAPDHGPARRLLADVLVALRHDDDAADRPGTGPRLSYANAAPAEAMIAAGRALGDDGAVDAGLARLSWLVELQTADGHLSPIAAGGWAPGEARPGFDQQPIEVAALADACARALVVTGDACWQVELARCLGWFLGDNDAGTPMYDPRTGGGYDGLRADGPNRNQGAESTLAWLMTLQHARRLVAGELAPPMPVPV